jgi:4-hydroxybenzoate polyprenyltransferase
MTFSTHGVVHEIIDPSWFIKICAQKLRDGYDLLMFSSTFVGIAGMGMVFTSCFIQGIPATPEIVIPLFLVAFSVYNLNRKSDEEEDAINRQGRYAFTKRNERTLFIAAIGAYLIAGSLALLHGLDSLLVVVIPLLFGVLYSIPCIPWHSSYRRLKDIPVVKNCVVGSAWSICLTLYPISVNHGVYSMKTAIIFLFFFSYAFIASIIPDIRDRVGDELAGVRTIPIILGEERTRNILMVINITLGSVIFIYGLQMFSRIIIGIFLAGTIYTQSCISLFHTMRSRDVITDVLADGQFIFFTMAICVLKSLTLPSFIS